MKARGRIGGPMIMTSAADAGCTRIMPRWDWQRYRSMINNAREAQRISRLRAARLQTFDASPRLAKRGR